MPDHETPYKVLLRRAETTPAAPALTDIDLAVDTRVELSNETALNGVAKAAHLVTSVRDELGHQPLIRMQLPLHWQAATLALGCWAAGATLTTEPSGSEPGTADVVVGGPDLLQQASAALPDHAWASCLHPFGLPFGEPPPFPVEDLTVLLREQPDTAPPDRSGLDSLAVRPAGLELTLRALVERAAELGTHIDTDARILSCLPWEHPDAWTALALALLGEHSIVLLRGLELLESDHRQVRLRRVCAAEHVSATLGCQLDALPRLA